MIKFYKKVAGAMSSLEVFLYRVLVIQKVVIGEALIFLPPDTGYIICSHSICQVRWTQIVRCWRTGIRKHLLYISGAVLIVQRNIAKLRCSRGTLKIPHPT